MLSYIVLVVQFRNISKYNPENIEYYVKYCIWVYGIDWMRLHFLDEVHIDERELKKPRVHCPRGQRYSITQATNFKQRVNCALLTDLRNAAMPIYLHAHYYTNNQFTFSEFLLAAIEAGIFIHGDYLVLDNVNFILHLKQDTFYLICVR
jgi:hypothetical protein